jgi:hypothetical protein
MSSENRRNGDSELAQRVAKLEVTSVQNTTILGDIDKKVTELSNQFLKHKGFMGGVIFTVSGLWAALLVGIDFLWRK